MVDHSILSPDSLSWSPGPGAIFSLACDIGGPLYWNVLVESADIIGYVSFSLVWFEFK